MNITPDLIKNTEFLDFANHLADEARKITLSYFRHNISHQKKTDLSPVTIADEKTENHLRKLIQQQYPTHGVIGEETENKISQSEYEWVIDPIDGTKNFISGLPLYGCLICLLKNGMPIVSIIDVPAQNERWFAQTNQKTNYIQNNNNQIVSCSKKIDLSEAILCSTDLNMFSESENRQADNLRKEVSIIRYNGDCYLYAMLSSGFVDIVLESDLKTFDFMPLIPIVEQAGGVITDWQGNPLHKNSIGQVLASANQTLHQKALLLLNQ